MEFPLPTQRWTVLTQPTQRWAVLCMPRKYIVFIDKKKHLLKGGNVRLRQFSYYLWWFLRFKLLNDVFILRLDLVLQLK